MQNAQRKREQKRAERAKRDKQRPPAPKPPRHPFDLPIGELQQVLPYAKTPHWEIPTPILCIMYKGLRNNNPQFAAQVLDWIALRQADAAQPATEE